MISCAVFEGYKKDHSLETSINYLSLLASFYFIFLKRENARLSITDVRTAHAPRGQNVSLIPERRNTPVSVQVASLVSAQVRVH